MEWLKCRTNVKKSMAFLMITLIQLNVRGDRDEFLQAFSRSMSTGSSYGIAMWFQPTPAVIFIPAQRDLLDYYTKISANVCTIYHPTKLSYLWTFCATGQCGLLKYSQTGTVQLSNVVTKSIYSVQLWNNCSLDLSLANETSLEILDENLYHLDLNKNDIAEFPPGYFCVLTKLKNLYLSRISVTETTKLGFLPSALCQKYTGCCLCRLKKLDLLENRISVVRKDSFCGMAELVILNMKNGKLKTIEDGAFAPLHNLQNLILRGNKLNNFSGYSFTGLSKLTNLDLSENGFRYLTNTAFIYLKNLKILRLENNKITSLPDQLFANQQKLHMLELSHNRLVNLSDIVFASLKSLKTLNLADNRLKIIHDDAFSSLTSIEELKLNNNDLTNFPVWKLSNLSKLNQLGIHRNKWLCVECDYVKKFRSFLQDHSNILLDSKQLFCTDVTNLSMPLISFDLTNCYVNSTQMIVANDSNHASIWGSLLAVFILLTIIAVLIFIYRHEMQVLVYSRYGVRLMLNRPDDQPKIYDAFISYSNDDEAFLVNDLLPGLEKIPKPYHLCLHHRDFAPGAFITDSIMQAVMNSSLTLILLSDGFMKSEWCRFEFKTAHIQMMNDRCNRILVIVIGSEIPKDLDPEMELYMKTNTYLRWDDRWFWKKLYFALPEPNKEVETVM